MTLSDLDQYDYALPAELIRRVPLEPRDSAQLFIYDTATDTITFDTFRNIAQYLPKESLMVLNNTRVWPARLWLKKETGGKIEVLVLVNEWERGGMIPALVDRKVRIGEHLLFPDGSRLIVEEQQEQKFFFRLEGERSLSELLQVYGTTPIPHYLEESGSVEAVLRNRYQTVFATTGASVAAPTASLHFTEAVFTSLRAKGIDTATLTLDVGMGTFAPLREANFLSGKLHPERVSVQGVAVEKIQMAQLQRRPIITVGTTATRSLEALFKEGTLSAGERWVDLFIYPPYQFQAVDILITNFHLPKTSLMLLVDAFLRNKGARKGIVDLYGEAIRERYSFYSFGDSMLIL